MRFLCRTQGFLCVEDLYKTLLPQILSVEKLLESFLLNKNPINFCPSLENLHKVHSILKLWRGLPCMEKPVEGGFSL